MLGAPVWRVDCALLRIMAIQHGSTERPVPAGFAGMRWDGRFGTHPVSVPSASVTLLIRIHDSRFTSIENCIGRCCSTTLQDEHK